jgi:hypothetical protein
LPLGVTAGRGGRPATYRTRVTTEADIDSDSGLTLDTTTIRQVEVTVHSTVGSIPLSSPIAHSVTKQAPALTAVAYDRARHYATTVDRRQDHRSVAAWMIAATIGLLLAAGASGISVRRTGRGTPADTGAEDRDPLMTTGLDTQVSLT